MTAGAAFGSTVTVANVSRPGCCTLLLHCFSQHELARLCLSGASALTGPSFLLIPVAMLDGTCRYWYLQSAGGDMSQHLLNLNLVRPAQQRGAIFILSATASLLVLAGLRMWHVRSVVFVVFLIIMVARNNRPRRRSAAGVRA
jgi:hypothetical protein